MLDFNTLTEFSHTYCVAICAFLVPANLLMTLQTVIWTGQKRPRIQVGASVLLASLFAMTMIFHVFSWFAIGVVMPPTYILLLMAITCLTINVWAIAHPGSIIKLMGFLGSVVRENFLKNKSRGLRFERRQNLQ